MQREHIVKDGVFIPQMGVPYPNDPQERLLRTVPVRTVVVDEHYPYLMRSFKEKCFHYLVYAGIFTIVFPLHVLRYGLKITGREHLRKNKALFTHGAITVANHVYRWDFLAVVQAVATIGRRRLWFPALADNLNGKDALQIRSAGGIPVPTSGMGAARRFNEALDTLAHRRKWLHVFPEQYRWNWYEPIRPFHTGAFSLAYRYNVPVIPMAISFRPVTGWRKRIGLKEPLVTLSIGEPIVPNTAAKRKEEAARMCEEAHRRICDMAGIVQNGWSACSTSE